MAQFTIRQGLRVFQKSDKVPGGLAEGKSPKNFDPKALAQGTKVEMEHTKDPKVAREIAMDHLTEDKDYYRKLEGMESKPKDKVEKTILDFLEKNPKPTDKQVHALAGKLGLDEHKFEERVYALLAKKTGAVEKSMNGLDNLDEYLEKAQKKANPNQMSLFGGKPKSKGRTVAPTVGKNGKLNVIAMGPKGGKIVGYKNGKPIYYHEMSAQDRKAAGERTAPKAKEPEAPKAKKANFVKQGDRVSTSAGAGTVNYVRVFGSEAQGVSVILDSRKNNPGYSGTMFSPDKVNPVHAEAGSSDPPAAQPTERGKIKTTETMTFDEVDKLLNDTFDKLVGPMKANLTGKERQVPAAEASKVLAKAKAQARRMSPGDRNKVIALVRKYKQDAQKYAKRLQQAVNKVGYGEVYKARATRDTLKRYLDAFEADKKEINKPGKGKYTTDKPAKLAHNHLADARRQIENMLGTEGQKFIPKDLGDKLEAAYQEVVASNQDSKDWDRIEMQTVLYKVAKMVVKDIYDGSKELQGMVSDAKAEIAAKEKAKAEEAERTKPRATSEMPGGGKLGKPFKVGDTLQFGRHQYKVTDLKVADKGGKTEYTVTMRNVHRGTKDYEITVDTKDGWSGFGLPDSARYALYGDNGPEVLGDTVEGGLTKETARIGMKLGGKYKGYSIRSRRGNKLVIRKPAESYKGPDYQGRETTLWDKAQTLTFTWDGRGYKRGGDYLKVPEGEAKKSLNAIESLAQYGRESLEKSMEEKPMSAIDELATYGMDPEEQCELEMAKAQAMPEGGPKQSMGQGEEQGGKLAGVGTTSGSSDSSPNKGFDKDGKAIGASAGKKDKLSEDDEDEEDQMKPGTKPIERTTRKSMDSLHGAIPAHQREVVAHEHAQEVSRLQKGEGDIVVGVGVAEAEVQAPVELDKGRMWDQGPDSLIRYSEEADLAAERLFKSDAFYANESPTITPTSVLIHQRTRCPACKSTFAKSLTACPKCGHGSVHQALTKGVVEDYDPDLAKSNRPLRPARQDKDLFMPNGVRFDEE